MALFGNKKFDWGRFGATLQDAGATLGGRESDAIGALRQQRLQEAEHERMVAARQQLEQAIQSAYAPQPQAPRQMGPTVDEGIPQSPRPPVVDPTDQVRRALLMANVQGLKTGSADQLLPEEAYQFINGGNGVYGVGNKRTGEVQDGQLANPLMDEKQSQLQAMIEQYKAMAEKARSEAELNRAKTKTGGFAPRAPARGRAPAKTLPPLPPGFVVSQ